jgi:hypothetical protein
LILLGFWAVSAFVSHAAFCTVAVFDSPRGPTAKLSHTHSGPGNNRDSYAAMPAPEVFSAASGTLASRSIFGDSPIADWLQNTGRTRHTSFLGTIQVES